jgi:hypothetical protein
MVDHGTWSEKVNLETALEILQICIGVMVDKEGDHAGETTPPKECKTYFETLQYVGDSWFIWYNDHTGEPKIAMIGEI